MAMPPVTPLIMNGNPISCFQRLATYANPYLKEYGITLSFKGYYETLNDYKLLKSTDSLKAWKLSKEINAWSEYFSSVANLIQKLYLDSETDKLEKQSVASIREDRTKVANGTRLANKDENVIESRKKRNTLKSLYDELMNKVDFLNRTYYHCKQTYELNSKIDISDAMQGKS